MHGPCWRLPLEGEAASRRQSTAATLQSRYRAARESGRCTFLRVGVRWSRYSLSLFLVFGAVQSGHFAAFAEGEEAGRGVGHELGAGVCDVEVAHGELADAVARREGGFGLLHAEALGMEGEVRLLGVEDGLVVAAAQLQIGRAHV